MSPNYSAWIKAAEERLAVIEAQEQALAAEKSALKQSIDGFRRLPNTPAVSQSGIHPAYIPQIAGNWIHSSTFADQDLGLTDAIRAVLKATVSFMAPTEIRDAIVGGGF